MLQPVANRPEVNGSTTSATLTSTRYVVPVPETYNDEYESSARLVVSAPPAGKPNSGDVVATAAHSLHTGAWQRERAREQRTASQRRSIA